MKFGLCNCARVLLAIVCTAGTTVCSWGGQPLERLNLLEYVGNFDDDQDVAGDDERCPRNGYSYGIANGWGPMNGRYDKQVFEPQVRSDSPYRGRRYQRVAALRSPSETKVMDLGTDELLPETGIWVPGRRLEVSIKVRSKPGTVGLRWKVWCNWKVEPGTEVVNRDIIIEQGAPPSQWTLFEGEVAPPANAKSIKFWAHVKATRGSLGAIDFDDLRVEDLRPLPQAFEKPLKLFWMYKPLNNWVETAQKADAVGLHKYHLSGAYHAVKPGFLNLHWVRTAYTAAKDAYCDLGIANLFDYSYVSRVWPSWLLKLKPDCLPRNCSDEYALDLGQPSYRNEFVSELLARAGREHWDALMLDYFHPKRALNNPCSRPGDYVYPCDYPTDEAWHSAVTGFLQALQPLRSKGIKLIPNMGLIEPDVPPWLDWMSRVDGAIIEWGFVMRHRYEQGGCALDYFDEGNQWWPSWRGKFLMLQASRGTSLGNKNIMINHRLLESDHDARRFALASYLCAMTDMTYFGLSTPGDCHRTDNAPIWSDDFTVPLGKPVDTFVRLDESLREHRDLPTSIPSRIAVFRRFENGMVVVNPHKEAHAFWRCDATLVNLDGRRFSPGIHSIAPREGLILLYANRPRVEITISAIPSLVFPGGLITYVVTYRNVGEGAAENVVVSGRVPDKWCTFHSASDGGQFIGNKEVRWNIGSLAPGSSGSRWFKVRVK